MLKTEPYDTDWVAKYADLDRLLNGMSPRELAAIQQATGETWEQMYCRITYEKTAALQKEQAQIQRSKPRPDDETQTYYMVLGAIAAVTLLFLFGMWVGPF